MSNGQTAHAPAIKMCLVGDMAVGKTSLAHVFLHQPFKEHYQATIGGVVMSRTLEEPHVTCQVWDTAGMERYRALLPHYMRQARCAVIVYDVSNRDSFDSVKNYWLDFVESCGEEGLVKVLVGNKMDVSERLRAVNTEEGAQLARSRDMLFIETSAKFELKVDDLFIAAARKVLASPRPPDLSDSLGPECPVIKLDRSRSKRNLGCFGMLRMVFK